MKASQGVALITGGGSGIGAATARLFASKGMAVSVTGRRRDPIEALAVEVRASKGQAVFVSGDVSDTIDCQRMVDETLAAFGRIDVLVNNAGMGILMAADETTDELWDQMIGINLSGPFRMIRAVLPCMIASGSGSIVNVSSILGQSGMKRSAAYSATKAGLDQLTRVIAVEYADRGIRVNAVAPAWVDTPMTESIQSHDHMYDRLKKRHPLGRFGAPVEVARAIWHLASEESSWTTGAVLSVDGGWTAV